MSDINRRAWNAAMPQHQKIQYEKYNANFQSRNYSVLTEKDETYLRDIIKIKNKSVVQFCCNNGVELMSLYNIGAKNLIGFDICDVAIEEATVRCSRLGYPIQFVRSDVFEINLRDIEPRDIVFISVGSLRWLKSIDRLYTICRAFLKKGGSLYISEIHPFAEIINDDRDIQKPPLEIITSYCCCKKSDIGSLDYVGHTNDILLEREWYIHTFTEIIGLLSKHGFRLAMFEESEEDLSGVYQLTSKQPVSVPLSFRLEAIAE